MRTTTEARADGVSSLPRTLQFLIGAAEPAAHSAADRRLAMTSAEWAQLPAAAHRHGLSALLHDAVSRTDAPASVREMSAAAALDRTVQGLRGLSEAAHVSSVLQHAGITSVCLKGPVLAEWLYGSAGFRRFSDLDILVAPRDLTAAYHALVPHGYQLPAGMSFNTARTIYAGLGAWPLAHAERYPLDLHFRPAHVSFAPALTAAEMIDDSCRPIGVHGIRMPSPTHAALLLLGHASKHLWCTLEMLLAIARVMRRTDVDWERVRERALRAGGWNGCVTGLEIAAELFAVPVPAGAIAAADKRSCEQLRQSARAALLRPDGVFANRWEERRAHRAALDRWSSRCRYDMWRMSAPTPAEWAWHRLPERLTMFYAPLRLTRLAARAASTAIAGSRSLLTGTTAVPLVRGGAARRSTRAVQD